MKKGEESKKGGKKNVKDEIKHVKGMLSHLEDEYRKANISEKHYTEMKEKYKKRLKKLDRKSPKTEHKKKAHKKKGKTKKKEKTKPAEEAQIEKPSEEIKEKGEVSEEEIEKLEKDIEKEAEKIEKREKKKGGFLGKLFGKKEGGPREEKEEKVAEEAKEEKGDEKIKEDTKEQEEKGEEKKPKGKGKPKKEKKEKEKKLEVGEIEEVTPEVIEQLSKQMAEEGGGGEQPKPEIFEETETERKTGGGGASDVEIEKIKVMIDTIRERSRVTEETIQSISEGIGEMRSMVFQIDASIKEMGTKMERVEEDVSEVRPQEVAKKFREISENLNSRQMEFEKLQTKVTDVAGKTNEITELIKGIGGIENLVDLNKNIQERVNDINEAEKYIERIGTKTEKMFIDLSKGLEDLVILRAKQDDLDGSLKDINKAIDALNVRFGSYFTIKDMEEFKQEFLFVKKQMEEVSKILPIAELKLPEDIIKLRRDREDIRMLLDSVDEQFLEGKMSEKEYENVKSGNVKKLERIERRLKEEWKRFEAMMGGGEIPVESVEVEEPGMEKRVKVVKKVKKKRRKRKKEKTKKETEATRKRKILSSLKRFK